MGKVWSLLVAFVQLLWYNIKASLDEIYREKRLREATEKRNAELEAQRLKAEAEAAEKDRREGSEIVERHDGRAAGEFLRRSFPADRKP